MEVVTPGLECLDDSKEFSVIDIIVSFCRREELGQIGAGVLFPIGVDLEKDSI